MIHASVIVPHFREFWLFGVFFVAAAGLPAGLGPRGMDRGATIGVCWHWARR